MAANRVLRVLVEGHSFLAMQQRGWCGEGVDGHFVLEWKAGGSKISHCVQKLSFSRLSAFDVVILDIGGNDLLQYTTNFMFKTLYYTWANCLL